MIGYNGALLEVSEDDFILGGEDFDINKLPKINTKAIEYNQLEYKLAYGNCLCTAYARIGTASDNLNYKISDKDRMELVKLRYNAPDFNPKVGGLLSEGINITRNYLKKLGKDVISYRFSTKSQLFWDLINKGYSINIGINVSTEFSKDAQDNGIVESVKFGTTKYGHSIRVKNIEGNFFVDNYIGLKKYNTYKIKDLKALVDNGIVFAWAYILFEGEAKKVTIWNGSRPNDIITRFELNTILKRLTSSNKDFYNLTNPNKAPTLQEAKIMVKRATGKEMTFVSVKRGYIIGELLK